MYIQLAALRDISWASDRERERSRWLSVGSRIHVHLASVVLSSSLSLSSASRAVCALMRDTISSWPPSPAPVRDDDDDVELPEATPAASSFSACSNSRRIAAMARSVRRCSSASLGSRSRLRSQLAFLGASSSSSYTTIESAIPLPIDRINQSSNQASIRYRWRMRWRTRVAAAWRWSRSWRRGSRPASTWRPWEIHRVVGSCGTWAWACWYRHHDHHIIISTYQHINISTYQHINISTHQDINTSTYQHINTSTYQHINISTHQHINISTYQHIKIKNVRLSLAIATCISIHRCSTILMRIDHPIRRATHYHVAYIPSENERAREDVRASRRQRKWTKEWRNELSSSLLDSLRIFSTLWA